ncbi:MAG: RNA 2',3'-cyclic phosphodiesterase [Clostridia bacterium]|nr:RNA 2',3'-cyclic phosphodiesterase [Clostridia bacterium]
MRLFFGLSLPDEIRAVTARCARDAAAQIPGRYALPENHHITLAFVGEVPEHRLGDAQRVLSACVSHHPAPKLSLDGYGYFGRAQNGILILRVKSEPALAPLHDALIRALHEEGLPADPGPCSPHITLARHAQIGETLPACPAAGFRAGCAHVYLSARDADSVLRYTPLYTVSFAK